jgi:hypothetical protein
MSLLISDFQEARIAGISHWHLAEILLLWVLTGEFSMGLILMSKNRELVTTFHTNLIIKQTKEITADDFFDTHIFILMNQMEKKTTQCEI